MFFLIWRIVLIVKASKSLGEGLFRDVLDFKDLRGPSLNSLTYGIKGL